MDTSQVNHKEMIPQNDDQVNDVPHALLTDILFIFFIFIYFSFLLYAYRSSTTNNNRKRKSKKKTKSTTIKAVSFVGTVVEENSERKR